MVVSLLQMCVCTNVRAPCHHVHGVSLLPFPEKGKPEYQKPEKIRPDESIKEQNRLPFPTVNLTGLLSKRSDTARSMRAGLRDPCSDDPYTDERPSSGKRRRGSRRAIVARCSCLTYRVSSHGSRVFRTPLPSLRVERLASLSSFS